MLLWRDAATVDDFTGNMLDASSATTHSCPYGHSLFSTAALSFSIIVGGGTPHTFTYKAASPSSLRVSSTTLTRWRQP